METRWYSHKLGERFKRLTHWVNTEDIEYFSFRYNLVSKYIILEEEEDETIRDPVSLYLGGVDVGGEKREGFDDVADRRKVESHDQDDGQKKTIRNACIGAWSHDRVDR